MPKTYPASKDKRIVANVNFRSSFQNLRLGKFSSLSPAAAIISGMKNAPSPKPLVIKNSESHTPSLPDQFLTCNSGPDIT